MYLHAMCLSPAAVAKQQSRFCV